MSDKFSDTVFEREREVPVLDRTDVLVVGGGPAGLAAAISAARQGARVDLIERYGYVGGMATGGLVLMLDRMGNDEGEQVVRGMAQEIIRRLDEMGAVIFPPPEAWGSKDVDARVLHGSDQSVGLAPEVLVEDQRGDRYAQPEGCGQQCFADSFGEHFSAPEGAGLGHDVERLDHAGHGPHQAQQRGDVGNHAQRFRVAS